jgi:hypothetical protein
VRGWRDALLSKIGLRQAVLKSRERALRDRADNESLRELGDVLEELLALQSEPLIRKAHRLHVEIPLGGIDEHGNKWLEHSPQIGHFWLTSAGWRRVTAGIREEERYRREVWTHRREWLLGFLSLLIGVLGAAAALVGALIGLETIRRGSP